MSELIEYEPGTTFPGVIGRTVDESTPAWPVPVRAREGMPNVVFFVLDDVGYGQMSVFGGLCQTPTLDRLADNGLRYTNFHTTALCSPTRSCVLTGRNHHSSGVSGIMELATGFPGSNCRMPFENGMLSEILKEQGYNTLCVGKWHLTPSEESTAAGPYDRWPLGRGFERYYGFLAGDTNQWYPDLVYDNHAVPQPRTPEEGYHLNIDLADKAIEFIQDAHVNAPQKPFFLYFATGACHAPHHVEKEWIARYRGKFDMGWDRYREIVFQRQKEMGIVPSDAELSSHDPDVPEWDSCTDDERRLYARMMEVYAGFVEQTDHHFGRIISFLEEIGELDNTLIMVLSDNGASAEGGPKGSVNEMLFFNYVREELKDNLALIDELGGPKVFNHYAWGWTWAGDTPFRRWKRETYRGGITDPFVVFWPRGIKARGETRSQYVHAIDLVPTVLETLDIEPPRAIRGVTQSPIEGVSLARSFHEADVPSRHVTQYYEMCGHRSIYHDGWKAVCPWPGPSFTEAAMQGRRFSDPVPPELLSGLEASAWELYHVAEDIAECHNVAVRYPEKLQELVQRWWTEAGKYNVLPLDGRAQQRLATVRPQMARPRKLFVFYPGGSPVNPLAAPKVYNVPHSITAEAFVPPGGAQGVLLSQGNRHGGYCLYVKDRRLHYVHNYVGRQLFKITSVEEVPEGEVALRYEFQPTGQPRIREGKGAPGRGQLYINSRLVGSLDIPVTTPIVFAIEGLTCGYDGGDVVVPEDYSGAFPFTGRLKRVTVDLSGELTEDSEAEMAILMMRQ